MFRCSYRILLDSHILQFKPNSLAQYEADHSVYIRMLTQNLLLKITLQVLLLKYMTQCDTYQCVRILDAIKELFWTLYSQPVIAQILAQSITTLWVYFRMLT